MKANRKIRSKTSNSKPSWKVLLILLAIPFTVLLTQFQQDIRTSAQMVLKSPPVFFCLAMGESNRGQCASSTIASESTLEINGFPLNRNKTVYYNDTLTGNATYTNTGDVPITIKKLALVAESKKGNKRVQLNPSRQNVVVQPGKTVTISGVSRFFESRDPGGVWEVFSEVTLADGQTFDSFQKTIITVSTACTGLRAIPLTDADTGNLKALCSQNPDNKLCKSRQYCELTGGEDCKQKAPQQDYLDKNLQCDENIIIPEEEQNLLEELCKTNPNSDTCKEFCGRTFGSSICPDPNAVATATTQAVAGVKIIAQVRNSNTGEICKDQSGLLPNGCCKPACAGDPIPPAAPPPAAPPPAAPPPPANQAPQCISGLANKIGECCAVGTCIVNGLCSRACGGAPAPGGGGAPAPGGGGAPAPTCQTKNTSGQCCKYNGPLLSTGQCPTAPGGGGAPPKRVVLVGKEPARECAAGKVRNSAGNCVAPAQPPAPGSQPGSTGAVCDVNGNNQCPPGNICQSTNGGRSGVCKATNPPPPPPPARHCDASGTTCNVNQPSNCCSGVCVKAAIPFVNTDRCQ